MAGARAALVPALVPVLLVALAGCDTGPVRGLMPPEVEATRSAPAAAYPNVNITPERAGRPKSPEEVEQLELELERLREGRSPHP